MQDRWRDAPEPPGRVDPLLDSAVLEGFALLPGEHAARGGRPVVFRAPRRARGLRPEEAARRPAARVSPLASFDPRGAQAALGGRRSAADADRGTAGRRGPCGYGADQLGYPLVGRHPGRQAGRGAATVGAGRPRRRAGEHRGVQGPRARRQAPGGRLSGSRADPSSRNGCRVSSPGSWRSSCSKAARNRARERSGERCAAGSRSRSGSRSA